ncbi:MAG: alpha/beta hydrolase [Candidatus Marinimicrobia bacterium]|nr:alpha/beta hydrolase [Candidatus Neomarinimicrobiota bacterium]
MMPNITRQIIEIRPGRNLSIRTGGNESKAMLMMIHGAGGRGAQWHNQVEKFIDHYFIVVPDLMGHGDSPVPKAGYSFIELAQDMEAIFQHYKCTKNIVVGHSYGTAFALWLAGQLKNEIDQLVLIGATPFRSPQINSIWKLPVFVLRLIRPIMSKNFARGAFHPDTDPVFIRRERVISDRNPIRMMKALFNGMVYDGEKDLSRLTLPILIINGEADKFTTVAAGRELAEHLPNGQFVELKGASHLAMMEQPQAVNDLITAFTRN